MQWLLPLGLAVMVIAGLATVLVLANQAAEPDAPPAAPAFSPPEPLPYVAYDVERNQAGTLRLSGGPGGAIELNVAAGTDIWLLEPATLADLEAPMVVNVIAIPNEVRNFAIRSVVFGPSGDGGSITGDEFMPVASDFAGHEASAEPAEKPVMSGIVRSIQGNVLNVLQNGGSNATIEIDGSAPLRIVTPVGVEAIRPGYRVAFHLDAAGNPDPARGVLVLPE